MTARDLPTTMTADELAAAGRRCQATTRAGKPCKAPPLKGRTHCRAHDPLTPADARFGSSEQAAHAGALGGAAGRRPRVVDIIRERIEANAEPVIGALWDGLTAERGIVVGSGEYATVDYVADHDIRIKAARELLDRGYGRPRQGVEVTGADGGPIETTTRPDLSRLSTEERDQLEQLLERAAPADGPAVAE